MPEAVTYARSGSFATITLDDGKVNVLSLSTLTALEQALDQAAADQATVLLCGREGRFSAGFDLPVLQAGGSPALEMLLRGFRLAERLLSFPTPVVIACTGHALAMGSFLLLSADVRVGAAGPFKIGANEVAIGLPMPFAAIEICRQRLVPAHFTRAVITAELYNPEQAVAAGFLDHVVPPGELLAAAHKAATTLSQLNMPAHFETKRRARAGTLQALRKAIEADDAALRQFLGL
ncbi:MAG: crotonase/enoyl-CoA hydratase family protein [Polyangia bacterium]